MFSGIVQEIGKIKKISGNKTITFEILFSQAYQCKIGDSVSINGVCLTVINNNIKKLIVEFQAIPETLEKTNLKNLLCNNDVNIELSLKYGDSVGGHMVQGHVDSIGKIQFIQLKSLSLIVGISANHQILSCIINKGYITIDGMSITVIKRFKDYFTIALIPETIQRTIAKNYKIGTKVNLEADPINKYIYHYMEQKEDVFKY